MNKIVYLKDKICDFIVSIFDGSIFDKHIPFTETRAGRRWISKTLPALYNRYFEGKKPYNSTIGEWNVVANVLNSMDREVAIKIYNKYFADKKIEKDEKEKSDEIISMDEKLTINKEEFMKLLNSSEQFKNICKENGII